MVSDRCLKGYKETLNFTKTYVTGILPGNLYYPYKGMDADFHVVPLGYRDKDGVDDDADKTALSPMNLIVEVHKIGLQVYYTFRNESHRLSDYNNDPFRVPNKVGIDAVFSILQIQCQESERNF
jgi:hypothetical protein